MVCFAQVYSCSAHTSPVRGVFPSWTFVCKIWWQAFERQIWCKSEHLSKNNNHCLVKKSFYSAVVSCRVGRQSMLLIASFCKSVILSGTSHSSTTIQRYELVSEAKEHNLQLAVLRTSCQQLRRPSFLIATFEGKSKIMQIYCNKSRFRRGQSKALDSWKS